MTATNTPTVGAKHNPNGENTVTIRTNGQTLELAPGDARALAHGLTKKATLAEDH